jgi:hypothetical protein
MNPANITPDRERRSSGAMSRGVVAAATHALQTVQRGMVRRKRQRGVSSEQRSQYGLTSPEPLSSSQPGHGPHRYQSSGQ